MSSGRGLWRKSQRILRPGHFSSLVAARPAWHAARRWLSVAGYLVPATPIPCDGPCKAPAPSASVLVGISVSKRFAKRSVQRNLMKRILRESARHALAGIGNRVPQGQRLEMVFRLRGRLPDGGDLGLAQVKAQTRDASDQMWQSLAAWLDGGAVPLPLRDRRRAGKTDKLDGVGA